MKLLDVRVDNVTMSDALEQIKKWLQTKQSDLQTVVTVNPEMIMAAQKDSKLKQAINTAAICVADGTGVRWAAKVRGKKIKQKVTGIDLVYNLADMSQAHKWRWYLLGAAPGVAKQAANKLKVKYPKIIIAKAEDGGVIALENLEQQQALIDRINSFKPDILVISLGVPKQERFMDFYKNKLNAKVAIGAGGTLDFIAGKQKRAPKLFRFIGLEWLWRLIRQPKRIKRIWTATIKFPLAILRSKRQAS